jgi:osmoprotectant transport system substrate-binding protein
VTKQVQQLDRVIIRFAGDSGDGMQLTGDRFTSETAAFGNDLSTLSDLGDLGEPVMLAAAPDCKGRGDCEAGLTDVYGIEIERIIPTGFGTQPTKNAVLDGEAQLGLTGTTDASLDALGLVLLEDDQGIQPAQNLIPAVNTEFLDENPDVADVLNELSATLTTEDLASLNGQVDIERRQPTDVAEAYLQEQGLL